MARNYIINGEVFVRVKGNGALALSGETNTGQLHGLGLTLDSVQIIPRFVHHDLQVDDFGPEIPAEILWMLADARINMTLVHYDHFVLDAIVAESMAGGIEQAQNLGWAGYMAPAGTPMGGNKALHASGNHYVSLNLSSPILNFPWRFPAAYLSEQPVVIPLGSRRSEVQLKWRAIPYSYYISMSQGNSTEIVSSGVPLWTRVADTA